MAELASFWVGDPLGPIEIASIKSFLRHGDNITVFSPHPLELPEGAKWADANEIYPSETILRDRKTGSAALHSDLFRYALMAKTDMIWVDLDIIALRKFDFESEWVFGYEAEGSVNSAVLRIPGDSKTLAYLLKLNTETRGVPDFFSKRRRLKYKIKSLGRGVPIQKWRWAWAGPRALTFGLNSSGEIKHTFPRSAFYHIGFDDAEKFVTPHALTSASFPEEAWGAHLWGNQLRVILKRKFASQVPEGSFLDLALIGQL